MIPGKFKYLAARTVDEAVEALVRQPDDTKLLAGGQSLIPLMKLRLAQPEVLVDISRLHHLAYIREENGYLAIGALTPEADLENSDLAAKRYRILVETSEVIADPIVRNVATVGGNLAHADPANDHPATMLALRAEIVATGPNGVRQIPIDGFFVGPFTTALEPGEILTEIRVPSPPPNSGGAYLKLERKVGDYAIAGVSAFVVLGDDGRVDRTGIGLTNAGLVPIRASEAERLLTGQSPTADTLAAVASSAASAADPADDLRGPAEYKRAVTRTLALRALTRAVERAQNGRAA